MAKREKYYHVQEFDKKLKKALSFLTADNHEERFYLLQDIVNILDKASSQSAHTLESLRLLDPRYQMAFYAEEIHNETQAVLDVLDSSSGKSGGEKESFAGVIMAATTNMATMAWRLYFFKLSLVTMPILLRTAISTGNSNTIPNSSTIELNIEI